MQDFIISADFPKSEIEFDLRFLNPSACYDYLFSLKRNLPTSTRTLNAKLESAGTIIGSSPDLNDPICRCCGQYLVVS